MVAFLKVVPWLPVLLIGMVDTANCKVYGCPFVSGRHSPHYPNIILKCVSYRRKIPRKSLASQLVHHLELHPERFSEAAHKLCIKLPHPAVRLEAGGLEGTRGLDYTCAVA